MDAEQSGRLKGGFLRMVLLFLLTSAGGLTTGRAAPLAAGPDAEPPELNPDEPAAVTVPGAGEEADEFPAEVVPPAGGGIPVLKDLVYEYEMTQSQGWWEAVRASSLEFGVGYPLTQRQQISLIGEKEFLDPYESRLRGQTRETEDVVGMEYELAF